MKKILIAIFLLGQFTLAPAQTSVTSWHADNGNGTFTNPLFYDEFSDPDIIRVGEDYYLAGTTMHSVPGLVILHSRDLVNWENISYCFDRFDFDDPAFSLQEGREVYGGGIWAPCIRYHNGKFYLFSNVNGKGLQVYTATDVRGPWQHINTKWMSHDLSVLFDDDDKIYIVFGYGEVKCAEMKPDLTGPVEGTERVIMPEGSSVGEGHHIYKIDGIYYIISADYSPMGRMTCARANNIDGPWETCVISGQETYGYHPGHMTTVRGRIQEDGYPFQVNEPNPNSVGCANIHQGGIVQLPNGDWWAVSMLDFHSVGRTVGLSPVTWTNGWPMFGLSGNPGRSPRTWLKPDVTIPGKSSRASEGSETTFAPYDRNDDFNGTSLKRVWQWNHNPDDSQWALKNGRLRLNAMPARQLMWARNSLTQRVIGPVSTATVMLDASHLKTGDVAGLGNINIPCSWIGLVKGEKDLTLQWFDQLHNDTLRQDVKLKGQRIWLRAVGNYDEDHMHYEYSTDGTTFQQIGHEMMLGYQLVTFQGSRLALFCFNTNENVKSGYAEFDDFTVVEPLADRSQNIPLGKTIRIINLATDRPMIALKHGFLYDTHANDQSPQTRFRVIDKGRGQVVLQCEDGRYVTIAGEGLAGDIQLTNNEQKAERFMWQDYLHNQFMLLSMSRHLYIGKNPLDGSPYSCQFFGADPNRKNGAVMRWE